MVKIKDTKNLVPGRVFRTDGQGREEDVEDVAVALHEMAECRRLARRADTLMADALAACRMESDYEMLKAAVRIFDRIAKNFDSLANLSEQTESPMTRREVGQIADTLSLAKRMLKTAIAKAY